MGSTHLSSFGWSRRCRRSLTTDFCSSVFSLVFPKWNTGAARHQSKTTAKRHPLLPAPLGMSSSSAQITNVVSALGKAQPLAPFYRDLQRDPNKGITPGASGAAGVPWTSLMWAWIYTFIIWIYTCYNSSRTLNSTQTYLHLAECSCSKDFMPWAAFSLASSLEGGPWWGLDGLDTLESQTKLLFLLKTPAWTATKMTGNSNLCKLSHSVLSFASKSSQTHHLNWNITSHCLNILIYRWWQLTSWLPQKDLLLLVTF